MGEGAILTSASVDVDGAALAIAVQLDYLAPFEVWVAELRLPGWVTPRAAVSLVGVGRDQEIALHDLIQRTNKAVARYAPARKAG